MGIFENVTYSLHQKYSVLVTNVSSGYSYNAGHLTEMVNYRATHYYKNKQSSSILMPRHQNMAEEIRC
jgi:UDP-3-O-[3-hydroxymyristoyl] glucosamine N-acyltransferase